MKYALLGRALATVAVAVLVATPASAATRVEPIAKIHVGAQTGMVLSAAGSIWT